MGTIFVNKRPTGSWRLIETIYTGGEPKKKAVPVASYLSLGIDPTWPIEKVKDRVKQINAQRGVEKRKVAEAVRRVEKLKRIESAFLPKLLVEEFELEEIAHRPSKNKDEVHWKFVQDLIKDLEIDPDFFADVKSKIYRYYQQKKISHSYTQKVTFMLNLWGKFVCRKRRKYYEPVPIPTGIDAQRIIAAQRAAKDSQASDELTPEILNKIRDKMPNKKQFNWLGATVWFGLRPEEVDIHRCRTELQGRIQVLWVYQPKLTSIPEERRWKPIPILFKEQKEFLQPLLTGDVERPLNKIIKDRTGRKVTGYGGRKGFTDLMLSYGQKLEDISVWLGHQSIERTWRSYKNKQRVSYSKVTKRGA